MKTSSDIRTSTQHSFHRFGLHALAFSVALAGIAAAAPIAPSELVAPRIEIDGDLVKITIVQSVAGRNYQLQDSNDLTAPSWQNVESQVTGNGNNLSITTAHTAGAPRRFFRLKISDSDIVGLSLIPAGEFIMGRTSGDTDGDAPPVAVNVRPFYMAKYETTKGEWDAVQTWGAANGYTDLPTGDGKAANHPVHSIHWFEIVKWCNARSQMEGLTPVYSVSGAVMKTGSAQPMVNWNANGYRLPTEAEWEKAARGGVIGKRFPWGTDTISHTQANYFSSSSYFYDVSPTRGLHPGFDSGFLPYSSPVGSFAANGYGVHDMAGNVWEWCWDWWGESTYVNGATDPRGPTSGSYRVLRGGGCLSDALGCRAAVRGNGIPSVSSPDYGFRVARSSAP